jgi:hypothetical protein
MRFASTVADGSWCPDSHSLNEASELSYGAVGSPLADVSAYITGELSAPGVGFRFDQVRTQRYA